MPPCPSRADRAPGEHADHASGEHADHASGEHADHASGEHADHAPGSRADHASGEHGVRPYKVGARSEVHVAVARARGPNVDYGGHVQLWTTTAIGSRSRSRSGEQEATVDEIRQMAQIGSAG